MKSLGCVALGALVAACATEPAKPATLAIVSGDSQVGLPGTVLAESLVVSVSASDGSPFAGASVAWFVASGASSVSPLTSVSDATGHAASAVTTATAGPGTVTATVAGLAPVTFHLSSVSPCTFSLPMAFTANITASLSAADCVYPDGSYIDYYELVTSVQQAATIRMTSTAFDTYLVLDTPTGVPVAGNDDDATSTNSVIQIMMAPGTYILGANSYDPHVTGAYTLTSVPVSENMSACDFWFMTPAVFTNQQLAATDCVSAGYYADLAVIFLQAGRAYTFTQSSGAFDSYLELLDAAGNLVASDDNGAGALNSRIVFTPPSSAPYYIVAQSVVAGATGAYTLTVSAPVPAGAAGAASAAATPRGQSRFFGFHPRNRMHLKVRED